MKFHGYKPLLDLDDNAVKDGDKDVSLGTLAVNALELPPKDKEMSGEEKIARFTLQLKIKKSSAKGEPADISTDEAVAIKKAVANVPHYPNSWYGRIVEEIEK